MNDILVSIIIPIYNAEKYLKKCIDSVINQTYKNIEILLIDDGSSDKSGEICDNYSNIDNRIKVFHKKNGGVSSARKVGVENCNGDYVSFIDSDDYIESNYIKKMIDKSEKGTIDIICCNYTQINGHEFDKDKKFKKEIKLDCKKSYYKYMLDSYTSFYVLWGKIISKRIIKFMLFPNIKYSEDTYGMINLLEKANCIIGINYYGYNYVRNETCVSFNTKNITLRKIDELKTYSFLYENVKDIDDNLKDIAINLLVHYIFCIIKFNIYYDKYDNLYNFLKPYIKKVPFNCKYFNIEFFAIKIYCYFSMVINLLFYFNNFLLNCKTK